MLQSKAEANFVVFTDFLLYLRKYIQIGSILFEFMGWNNGHFYSFVGSHMLSCDLGVQLWLQLVNC